MEGGTGNLMKSFLQNKQMIWLEMKKVREGKNVKKKHTNHAYGNNQT